MRSGTVVLALLALGGCDYTGEWLFAGENEIPGVYIIEEDGGGPIVPRDISSAEDIVEATIYGEVGPSGTTERGGVTLEFVGTGEDICVWVDPETAYWNMAVGAQPVDYAKKWAYPDNIYDDGDIDLFVGLSVFYTGSPGERLGDFVVSYEDSLGNEVPISLSECNMTGYQGAKGVHAGRGTAEYCTIRNTDEGVSYTVVMETFAPPLDDDRLGFGVLIATGPCESVRRQIGADVAIHDECLIRGESMAPGGKDYGPWYGGSQIQSWPGSTDFEDRFCDVEKNMKPFCEGELDEVGSCSWNELPNDKTRCYCGDITDVPAGGAY
jgi:hypothetical protein